MKALFKSAIQLSLLAPSLAMAVESRTDLPAMPSVMTAVGYQFANQ